MVACSVLVAEGLGNGKLFITPPFSTHITSESPGMGVTVYVASPDCDVSPDATSSPARLTFTTVNAVFTGRRLESITYATIFCFLPCTMPPPSAAIATFTALPRFSLGRTPTNNGTAGYDGTGRLSINWVYALMKYSPSAYFVPTTMVVVNEPLSLILIF